MLIMINGVGYDAQSYGSIAQLPLTGDQQIQIGILEIEPLT